MPSADIDHFVDANQTLDLLQIGVWQSESRLEDFSNPEIIIDEEETPKGNQPSNSSSQIPKVSKATLGQGFLIQESQKMIQKLVISGIIFEGPISECIIL
ncbi:hypothetical protein GLAREA_10985 [Glarea lozoyensis ATCC 20868]|uniref:Uncharacterized protein n=1 Tax=Glarea lozoyensis (strain ATCC 20868 / MF5171) TaxID=1116229 RepID=S3DTP6_GLAL2|nr:uncharacterized protein GLAREA_10985 [Glarea lozoyensis ATCC 20868]EPE35286.1 hypothetical protein GLAREA_10985 [Glarea lozoyensis ATCC 20868]